MKQTNKPLSYEWYGWIEEIIAGGFIAVLNRKNSPSIKATFKDSDVLPQEQKRIEENGLFRWTVYKDGSERIDFIKITWAGLSRL